MHVTTWAIMSEWKCWNISCIYIHTHKGICFSDLRSSIVIHQLASTHCPWCNLTPPPPFFIDLMHWRHVSITTPCWGSRLVALRARVVVEERVGALSLSISARARASRRYIWPWHAGVGPLAGCMLGDGARDSASFDPPNTLFQLPK